MHIYTCIYTYIYPSLWPFYRIFLLSLRPLALSFVLTLSLWLSLARMHAPTCCFSRLLDRLLSLFLVLSFSHSLVLSFSLSLVLSFSLSLALCLSLTLSLSLSPSHSLPLTLSPSLTQTLSLSLFLYTAGDQPLRNDKGTIITYLQWIKRKIERIS